MYGDMAPPSQQFPQKRHLLFRISASFMSTFTLERPELMVKQKNKVQCPERAPLGCILDLGAVDIRLSER